MMASVSAATMMEAKARIVILASARRSEVGERVGAGHGVESGTMVVTGSGADGGSEDRTRLDGESAYGCDEEDGSDGGGGDDHGKMLAASHVFLRVDGANRIRRVR